ncbi:MAG: hypothetical protein U5K75_05620 [Ahrensia sp.]|nr:hypothetical protein [Ahrensia sp.]
MASLLVLRAIYQKGRTPDARAGLDREDGGRERAHHRDVPYRLIHCDKDKTVGDPDAGNLLVQGDNLEALKALLPYYAGKVKCIYIDPRHLQHRAMRYGVYNDNVNSLRNSIEWLGRSCR